MYSGMTKSALDWQVKIRNFVDKELIPWEVHAEKNAGNLPPDVEKKHSQIAIKLGLPGMGISKQEGGLGLSMFEQMIIWEQLGRVTNALCWCFSEAQDWMEENFTDVQKENYLYPLLKGEKKECYAITEKGSGSDVNGSVKATAEFIDNNYIINGEKWYVTSANKADLELIIQSMWENYGRILAEYVFLKDFRKEKLNDYIAFEKNMKETLENNAPSLKGWHALTRNGSVARAQGAWDFMTIDNFANIQDANKLWWTDIPQKIRQNNSKKYGNASDLRTIRYRVITLSLIHISEPTRPY